MGGGASGPIKLEELGLEPKYSKPFYMELKFQCGDFAKSVNVDEDKKEDKLKGDLVSVVIKLNAGTAPYACENFRRLCEKPLAEGGLIGAEISDIKPGLGCTGGLINKKNASSFEGKPFANEDEEDTDHGSWSVSMISNKSLPEGSFGSEFFVFSGDDGDTQCAIMDEDEGYYCIGKVVDGFIMFQMLDSLIEGEDWKKKNAAKQSKGGMKEGADSSGGPPGVPCVISAAEELKNYLPPTSKKDKHGRRRGRKRRQSNDRVRKGSISKREDDDGRGKNFASVIDMGSDDVESKAGNASVIESCQF